MVPVLSMVTTLLYITYYLDYCNLLSSCWWVYYSLCIFVVVLLLYLSSCLVHCVFFLMLVSDVFIDVHILQALLSGSLSMYYRRSSC